MGVPYTNVTGDLRQANYSSLREGKLEFRRRIEQFQHGTLVFQLCRPVWQRWMRDAVLAGALELPGFARDPAPYLAVKWIPPKWDWVDPLKDRKAEIEAIEAGLKSRSDVIESEGYDAEEVDRRIAADHAREEELGLKFGRPGNALGRTGGRGRSRGPRAPDAERGERGLKPLVRLPRPGQGAEIVIYDEIGAFGIPAKAFLDELKALGPVAELTVRINSPGGSVFDGVAIYNALKRHDAAITVWIDGIAASIASMIAMAGDEVVMPENAMLVLHDPSGLVMGTASDMRAMAEALDRMKAGMVAAYRDKSGRDDAEIEALMRAETWLSAQEAVALGLADRVEQPVRMAAHFDLSRFRNTPPQLAALVATPSPQEDDMSDSKKASPRKPGLDESATAQAAPPETSADDTAAGPASQPAAVASAEPRPTAEPSLRRGRSPSRTASAGNRAGDRPGCGPGRRAQGDARLRRRGARAVRPRRPGRSRRGLRRQGDAGRPGPPRPARGPRRRGRGHRHPQPGAAGHGRAGAACDRHRGDLRRPQPELPIGGIHACAQGRPVRRRVRRLRG